MNHDAGTRTITENNSYSERAASLEPIYGSPLVFPTGILVTFRNNWISIMPQKGIRTGRTYVITGALLQAE